MSRSRLVAIAFTAVGCATVILAALFSTASGSSQSVIVLGALMPGVGLIVCLRSSGVPTASEYGLSTQASPHDDRETFEEWRTQVNAALDEQSQQLEQRRQELNDRMLQYREFLEYPQSTSAEHPEIPQTQLSEKDREVNQLLEQEAARVYEKIRADGYKVDGRIDASIIRAELFDVIQRVARVYSPDSENPLLETSFDQLARACSRVCLQALVLVEQLPIDVQHYTIAQLYAYIRKAADAWGTWQTVSPWLTRVSRGVYAGRLAASSSPVTLGAWWLASELGRHGTKKLVDKYVDQRAVTFLNDAVRLVGNEVACVYGPGIRQRDPAWAMGAELTELLHRFPASRESMQASLRQITALPLRSEYDRIYLYRCLAEHKPSGFRLADATVLTRDEREAIATGLEQFFENHIHGATNEQVELWRQSFEEHFDVRLSLNTVEKVARTPTSPAVAIQSVHSFLTGAGGMTKTEALNVIKTGDMFLRQSTVEQRQLEQHLTSDDVVAFAPPDLDPTDEMTTEFLTELASCVARGNLNDEPLEALLLETGRYFRRGEDDMRRLLDDGWATQLRSRTEKDAPVSTRHPVPSKLVLQLLQPGDTLTAAYTGITLEPTLSNSTEALNLWLIVLRRDGERRAVLFDAVADGSIIWQAEDPLAVDRVGGFIIDDCSLSGGNWTAHCRAERLVLSGKFGTGFQTWFGPLLDEAQGQG